MWTVHELGLFAYQYLSQMSQFFSNKINKTNTFVTNTAKFLVFSSTCSVYSLFSCLSWLQNMASEHILYCFSLGEKM